MKFFTSPLFSKYCESYVSTTQINSGHEGRISRAKLFGKQLFWNASEI